MFHYNSSPHNKQKHDTSVRTKYVRIFVFAILDRTVICCAFCRTIFWVGERRRGKGEGIRDKGKGRREKEERRREKGAGTREKAEGRREVHNPRWPLASATTPLSSAACSRTAPAQASSRRSFSHRRHRSNYSLVFPPPPSLRVTRSRFANPYFRSLLFSSCMLLSSCTAPDFAIALPHRRRFRSRPSPATFAPADRPSRFASCRRPRLRHSTHHLPPAPFASRFYFVPWVR